MRFHSADSQLSLCAADGFRLATVNIPIEADATFHKLVPAKAIAQVIKALPNDGSIHIQIDVSFICFAMPHCTIVTRLIDGNYPDIERVIPKEHGCRTIVNKAALMRALKLSKLLNDIARLSIEETAIIVSSNNTERGNNKSTVDTLSTGEYHQIAVNVNYLTEALAAFDSEDVILETTSDKAPMVLKYPRASSDYTHIIMPMAIRN
jgi:DNA polymerase-3 subunit beta